MPINLPYIHIYIYGVSLWRRYLRLSIYFPEKHIHNTGTPGDALTLFETYGDQIEKPKISYQLLQATVPIGQVRGTLREYMYIRYGGGVYMGMTD